MNFERLVHCTLFIALVALPRTAEPIFSCYMVWPIMICGVALYEARGDSLLYSAYLLWKHSKHGASPVDSW